MIHREWISPFFWSKQLTICEILVKFYFRALYLIKIKMVNLAGISDNKYIIHCIYLRQNCSENLKLHMKAIKEKFTWYVEYMENVVLFGQGLNEVHVWMDNKNTCIRWPDCQHNVSPDHSGVWADFWLILFDWLITKTQVFQVCRVGHL